MKQIITILFGSHLYGTDTPESDTDYKSVYIPSGRDILLQRAKGSVSQTKTGSEGRNTADDVDHECFTLQRYLQLVGEGQTNALDMLFAPAWAIVGEVSPIWQEIVANKDRLVTRNAAAFVGYARAQASRYSTRGTRIAAARSAEQMLRDACGTNERVGALDAFIRALISKHEHMSLIEDETPHGKKVLMWEVCGRKMHYTLSIKDAHGIMKRVVDEYGRRAKLAEGQGGADWKALSHAVRVGEEALELLETGSLTFPLRKADHIRGIKLGQIPYGDVTAEIDDLLARVEHAVQRSSLPDKPDRQWIDDFVADVYRDEVLKG